ncbi:MAG TPA: hypothetical protein VFX16_06905 [Pseudonocardiaceae bacterium]|nr:hypothetical protein [Pseudonocardiaceae bacterium]
MTSVWAAQLFLAAGSGTANNQPGGQGQEFGSSDPIALILIIALFVAVAFLIRSMSKHLKKVPASFESSDTEEQSATETAPADGTEPAPDGGEVRHSG